MSPCQRYRESILDFVDGELDILRKKDLEHHLKVCPQCLHLLNQMRTLMSHLKKLPPVKASDDFQILLRETIRREIAGKRKAMSSSYNFTRRWIPAFSLGVLVILAGFFLLDRKTSLFKSPGSEANMARFATPYGEDSGDQVQYAIDEFPSSVSIARSQNDRGIRLADDDSLQLRKRLEDIRNRVTNVSF